MSVTLAKQVILLKQVGRKCRVYVGDELVLESGRVACKGYARGLADKTGLPYYNEKVSGVRVLVRAGKEAL